MAKARLRRGIELVKLANRIEALRMQEEESDSAPGDTDMPANTGDEHLSFPRSMEKGLPTDSDAGSGGRGGPKFPDKGAIFREVVLAKVREVRAQEEALKVERDAHEKEAKRRSFQG
jgi:calcium/calmodulin-dependent protein kinase I